jgi:hypothetical protein
MTIAFLLACQRSGTGALGSVLQKNPEIPYVGGVFHPDNIDRISGIISVILRTPTSVWTSSRLPNANLMAQRYDFWVRKHFNGETFCRQIIIQSALFQENKYFKTE